MRSSTPPSDDAASSGDRDLRSTLAALTEQVRSALGAQRAVVHIDGTAAPAAEARSPAVAARDGAPVNGRLAAPLRAVDGRHLGAIEVHGKLDGGDFGADDEAALQPFARLASAAIDNVRTHVALRASEQRFRTLFESIDHGFCIVEMLFDARGQPADYRFLEVNSAFAVHTGLVEAAGRTALEMVPDLDPWWIATYGRVALTGEPARFEQGSAAMGRWFDVQAVRYGEPARRQVSIFFRDITERKTAEARDRLLLAIDDTTRPLVEADAIADAAVAQLGRHLGADRAAYLDVEADEDACNVLGAYGPGLPPMVARIRLADLGAGVRDSLRADRPHVMPDVERAGLDPRAEARLVALQMRAVLAVPLVKNGRLAALIVLCQRAPRPWNDHEVELVRLVAARGWESIARASAVRALRDSQQHLQALFDRSSLGIAEMDVPGRLLYVNDRFCEMTGRPREALLAMRIQDLTGASDLAHTLPLYRRLVRQGEPFQVEHRYTRPDGEEVWVQHSVAAMRDDTGRVTHPFTMVLDVTERRRAEAALRAHERRVADVLRESEARFRKLADHAPMMVWVTEPDGRAVFLSQSWQDFTGRPQEASLGDGWLDALHPDDRAATQRAFLAANARRVPLRLEYRLRHRHGAYRWVLDAAAPRYADDGEFEGYIGSVIDISDRRHVEAALAESEARFRLMADNIAQLAWMADRDGRGIWHNRRWSDYTGLSAEQLRAAGWRAALHPEHEARVVEKISRHVDSGEVWEDTFPLRGAGGEYRWFLSRAVPLLDDEGGVTRWFGTCTDITEQLTAEAALREADRRKDEFIATLAHELRNPLAPIRNSLHVLRLTSRGDAAAERMHDMMERQVNHLVRLVDDLLEVARITRGQIELRRAPVELAAVVRSAVETSRPLLDAAQHALSVSLPDEPLRLDADAVRLAQVFANLLNNAAKYTEPGGRIALVARRVDERVRVSVRDSGIGIEPRMLPQVFELFTQVDPRGGRTQGGLGIGLSLASRLVRLHGGYIEAFSEGPGRGSEFVVDLPLLRDAAPDPAPRAHDAPQALPPRRVLVVDDNRDAADSLAMLLQFTGVDVQVEYGGAAALEALKRYRPSVVMLDIGMPGMDGFEVARRMRNEPGGERLTLIALTGWGQSEDRRRTLDAGFDHHLVKPADIDALQRLLASIASEGGRPA